MLLLLGGGAAVLQVLGPPPPPVAHPGGQARVRSAARAPLPDTWRRLLPPLVTERRDARAADRPGRDTPGPVADPDPALLDPMPGAPSDMLPRIAEDGRRPMQVYAAGFDRSSRRPRVGILLAGIGLNEDDSLRAITRSAGGRHPRGLPLRHQAAEAAGGRAAGAARIPAVHPDGAAGLSGQRSRPARADDRPVAGREPRPPALAAGACQGYAGVTDTLGALRGERFAGMPDQMDPILAEVGRRGCFMSMLGRRAPAASRSSTMSGAATSIWCWTSRSTTST